MNTILWRLAPSMALLLLLAPTPAAAIPPFQTQFKAMYAKPGTPLAGQVARVKCNVCHRGADRKQRNAYGKALSKLLDKVKDGQNTEKIRQAFLQVAKQESAGPGSSTFGQLLEAGKLPGGER